MPEIDFTSAPTLEAMDKALELEGNRDKGHRSHLGASIIGTDCYRSLWYSFRWATDLHHSARLLRIFRRGQDEEPRLIALLRGAGVQVVETDPDGNQWRFSALGGHFGGSMDGVALGLLEAPKSWHVLEIKTSGDKPFRELTRKGVEDSKPVHFYQMQIYMHWSGLKRAFYLVVNKNDDALYSERVKYQPAIAKETLKKAESIITSDKPLNRISEDPASWLCKFCDHLETCSGGALAAINCRTCIHAEPILDGEEGKWRCDHWDREIPDSAQREAWSCHRFIPELIVDRVRAAIQVDSSPKENWVEYQLPDGRTFRNGDTQKGGFSSEELARLASELIGSPDLQFLKDRYGAIVQ